MSPLIINSRTEKEILKACLSNDRTAQRDLFNMYAGKMMAISIRYTRHRLEAEDILQDAFIKVFSNLHSFKNEGSLEGWIRRIVVNTAIKNTYRKSFSQEDIGLENIKEDSGDPNIISALSEEEIINLIAELPDGYRIVFNLYAIEGYSHKEIAEMLDIDEATSRSQLLKARRKLMIKVQKLYTVAV